jgi:hypothetical protein
MVHGDSFFLINFRLTSGMKKIIIPFLLFLAAENIINSKCKSEKNKTLFFERGKFL